MLKILLKSILSQNIRVRLWKLWRAVVPNFAVKAYSQEGEDMILKRFFGDQKTGFYVDIGAHHPIRFSNTYYFYKNGWKGINVDAMPGSMKKFNRARAKDINIEKPVSDKKEILTYYAFDDPALNGFSRELSEERIKKGWNLKFKKELGTVTLEEILDNNLPEGQFIDFMSVDVEGFDFQVLKSNNFEKYKPKVILVEILGSSLAHIETNEIACYLKKYDYSIYAKAVKTVIFVNEMR